MEVYLGPCVRLSSAVATLFNRVHLVFYRSTEWSEKSLTTLILSRTNKLHFPNYIVSRTSSIFPTRSSLLAFESALQLQSEIDDILESPSCRTESGLTHLRDIFTTAYPTWKSLVASEDSHSHLSPEAVQDRIYLRRFTAGWIYTRIIHKLLYVLARNQEFHLEHTVLTELLAQRFFQPARRGPWYQRKALIEENYLPSLDANFSTQPQLTTKRYRQQALSACELGLQDPQTHVIYHYDLQKRIEKLEHRLKIPKKEQHDFSHLRLAKPQERVFYGERLNDAEIGRKSIWRDPRGEKKKGVSVEEMCLAHYAELGWKGMHTEGRLMRTLFAYIFYDILFLYVPNVFETEFQTCPLDLFTDAFFPTRASEINTRLMEISNGEAGRIVNEVWGREHEKRTCVVGLDWGIEKEVLEEVVRCVPGEALAGICRVFCQEYRQRSGGMPDLFLWKLEEGMERGECCFAEVKSEKDRLSETQRMWIHVLTGAGVRVELCAAKDKLKDEKEEKKKQEIRKMWPIKSG